MCFRKDIRKHVSFVHVPKCIFKLSHIEQSEPLEFSQFESLEQLSFFFFLFCLFLCYYYCLALAAKSTPACVCLQHFCTSLSLLNITFFFFRKLH